MDFFLGVQLHFTIDLLRYPEDKEDITAVIFEPWHYRYVGVEAATEIMERGITLEEYVAERGM